MARSGTDARPSADRQRAKTGRATVRLSTSVGRSVSKSARRARELLTQQEVEPVADVGDRDRGHQHGQERRVAPVATGRLAVAPGPVTGQ